MQKVRLTLAVLAISLMVSLTSVLAQDGTIVDVASSNEDFSTLVDLVVAADLAETLSGEGPFTVFAPTNAAFAELPEEVVSLLTSDTDLLTSVLTYHVLGAEVPASDVATGNVATVQGGEIAIEVSGSGAVTIDGVSVVTTDIEASNGIIHVIDAVLVPEVDLPEPDVFSVAGGINIAGSSTVGPLTIRISDLYLDEGVAEDFIPNIQITGTGGGFERFCVSTETDISNASRPIRDSERSSCEENGINPIEFRVGTDALAVAVATENGFLNNLTTDQLAFVFSDPRDAETGEVTGARMWSDIDPSFPEIEIVRFIPDTDSGTFDYFVEEIYEGVWESILEGEASVDDFDFYVAGDFEFDDDLSEEALDDAQSASLTRAILLAGNTQNSSQDEVLVNGLQGNTDAIGFFGFAFVQEGIRPLNVNDVEPNAATVDAATYPLARPLFIYSDADIMAEKPQVSTFINFYLQNTGDVIEDVGYFPASARALNLSKLLWLANTEMGM